MEKDNRMTLKLNESEFAKEYPKHFALLEEHGEELANYLRQGITDLSFSIDPATGTVTIAPAEAGAVSKLKAEE